MMRAKFLSSKKKRYLRFIVESRIILMAWKLIEIKVTFFLLNLLVVRFIIGKGIFVIIIKHEQQLLSEYGIKYFELRINEIATLTCVLECKFCSIVQKPYSNCKCSCRLETKKTGDKT